MIQDEIKLDSYERISDAIYDYAESIKNNFKTDINIKRNKTKNTDYSRELQRTIYNKAKDAFSKIGRGIFENNGEYIYVSNADIKESIAKTVRSIGQKELIAEHLELFAYLDKIIEKGVKVASAHEVKSRSVFKKWDYYVTPIKIDNKKYLVEFDTVIRDNNEKHFRLERILKLKDIKKQVVPTGQVINNQ